MKFPVHLLANSVWLSQNAFAFALLETVNNLARNLCRYKYSMYLTHKADYGHTCEGCHVAPIVTDSVTKDSTLCRRQQND